MLNKIRIISRKSQLALCQAELVKRSLLELYPNLSVVIASVTTSGDKLLNKPLARVGGKGLFVKELEQALLANQADIAVHSMKDVPVELPKGLCLTVICEREDARDAFISNQCNNLADLPEKGVLGTSSLRRQSMVKVIYPKLQIKLLRGNVPTRLEKLHNKQYDAIILAAAGLKRLNLTSHIKQYLDKAAFIPAVGQGAIGIECRSADTELRQFLKKIESSVNQKMCYG